MTQETSLLDEKHPLRDTTVIVDDPMGSLDANHLFNTYSFIKTKLSSCYQLFVMTHNYEFYSLIKEWALDDEKNKWKQKLQKDWNKWSIYLIRRTDDGSSTIEPIPPELLRFKSEYHYLFSTLLKFHEASVADYDYLFSQGLRMKNTCEDLAHVLVVPCGYFSSSAQAVL